MLSVINTIFGKILSAQITSLASKHSIICRNQHGFRSHRSTFSAVLVLAQQVNKALNNNKLAVVVFLDIRKAFDSVNHNIMLTKLHDYGFRGRIHKLLKCYLSDRQQRVVIDGFVSSAESVVAGAPQGSVIGPSLFSLHVSDFPSVLLYSEALMYADDTALIFVGDPLNQIESEINKDLHRVNLCFERNHLNINTDKTKRMVFHSRKIHPEFCSFNLQLMSML